MRRWCYLPFAKVLLGSRTSFKSWKRPRIVDWRSRSMSLKASAVTIAIGSGYPRNSCSSAGRTRLPFTNALESGARCIVSPLPFTRVRLEGEEALRILFLNFPSGTPSTERLRWRSATVSCLVMGLPLDLFSITGEMFCSRSVLALFFAFGIAGEGT